MLEELHTKGVGPAPDIDLDCTSRFNILTGDNRLGTTFLLDIICWCIAGYLSYFIKMPIKAYASASSPLTGVIQ